MTQLPNGWTVKRLSDVADVKLGRQRSPKNHSGPNMRPYLRAANVTWNGLDLADVKEMNFSPEELQTFRLQRGDVLVAEASGSRSEVGKAAIWSGEIVDCCYQNTLIRVRSRGPLPEYLRLVLFHAAISGRFGNAARGVGIHHLGARTLSEWPVVLPPEVEQRAIVEEIEKQLTRLNEAIAGVRSSRLRLSTYRHAVVEAALQVHGDDLPEGWRWATPKEIAKNEKYALAIGPFGSNLKVSDYKKEGVPLVFIRHIRSRNFDLTTPFITPSKAADLRAHKVAPGDVLITKMGDPPGDACVYPSTRPSGVMTADCIKLSPDPTIADARYLAYVIPSRTVRGQVLSVTRGVAQKKMSLGRFSTIRLPIPPRGDQDEIVALLDRQMSGVEQLESEVELGLHRAERLRQSIFEFVFTGEPLREAMA